MPTSLLMLDLLMSVLLKIVAYMQENTDNVEECEE